MINTLDESVNEKEITKKVHFVELCKEEENEVQIEESDKKSEDISEDTSEDEERKNKQIKFNIVHPQKHSSFIENTYILHNFERTLLLSALLFTTYFIFFWCFFYIIHKVQMY